MTIFELSEKNIGDAVALYKTTTESYSDYLPNPPTDEEIAEKLFSFERRGDFTYLFYDKGVIVAMISVCKTVGEVENIHVNFPLVESSFPAKFLEFAVKQLSNFPRIGTTVVSTDSCAVEMLEKYGFEYTGEQEYISKEHNVLRYKYVCKRKK